MGLKRVRWGGRRHGWVEFFDGTPAMRATSPCDLIFGQFLQVLFGCCFLVIKEVETCPFEVSSIPLGVDFDGARDGDDEEA